MKNFLRKVSDLYILGDEENVRNNDDRVINSLSMNSLRELFCQGACTEANIQNYFIRRLLLDIYLYRSSHFVERETKIKVILCSVLLSIPAFYVGENGSITAQRTFTFLCGKLGDPVNSAGN